MAWVLCTVLGSLPGLVFATQAPTEQQNPSSLPSQAISPERDTQFKQLATQLAEQRRTGANEAEQPQEQALELLDSVVVGNLNAASGPNLDSLNSRLATLVAHQPPIGEGYQVIRLGGSPPVYALLANFGPSGPSAVRIYSGPHPSYRLAARIDRFIQLDFFDDYLQLVPVNSSALVFVTVSGRTDNLQTGSFTAWRFDGKQVTQLWTSDLLPQSSYEVRSNRLYLTYCAESDEEQLQVCRQTVTEQYAWNGAWKRLERREQPQKK